ncbi:DUF2807 domain-containing protein [Pseudoduganella eburnea]|uniref:DUF2807 domain-containing protein n=1 Tax=Massilia eburnea TaxID=1776165 RepID=A0A6L6QAE1_9BURK|nr:DUF2807 domain-containing protein [Massilia eburnea]MTW09175.1 DUF2807 domain-containing protein [Massilia eburnea]
MFRLTLLAALLLPSLALAEDQVRKFDTFYGINVKGPVSVYVEVGKPQSVTISGEPDFIRRINADVNGGVLRVVYDETKRTSNKENNRITVTVPALTSYRILGAGESRVTNISGERIDISFEGAGAMYASGKVKLLRMKSQGVGQVTLKDLHAERADMDVNGMGDLTVYASDTLNLVANGMGSIKYFGHPKHFNKSANGLGSITAGD